MQASVVRPPIRRPNQFLRNRQVNKYKVWEKLPIHLISRIIFSVQKNTFWCLALLVFTQRNYCRGAVGRHHHPSVKRVLSETMKQVTLKFTER